MLILTAVGLQIRLSGNIRNDAERHKSNYLVSFSTATVGAGKGVGAGAGRMAA